MESEVSRWNEGQPHGYNTLVFPHADRLDALGAFHLAFFGVGIPILALRARRRLVGKRQPLPERIRHFQATALTIVLFTSLSLVVARADRIVLFPRSAPRLDAWILVAPAMYGLAVLFMRPRWRKAVLKRARIVHLFMPDTATERAWWIGVSVLAGIGEEITWRGGQTALLIALTGEYWTAALASAISFGAAHAVQGLRSAAVIVAFALGFAAIVWATGSLVVAMAVHVAYDITAGLSYGRLGRELGYRLEPDGAAPA